MRNSNQSARNGVDLPDEVRALLPMTPAVFYTLFALAEDEQHGYGIMQAVGVLSEGAVSMGPGTLYSTIQRLLNLGLVVETTKQKRAAELERRKRFYQLTGLGRRVFDLEVGRMKAILRRVGLNRLGGPERESQ